MKITSQRGKYIKANIYDNNQILCKTSICLPIRSELVVKYKQTEKYVNS